MARPVIYIGLGGTGNRTLAYVKEMYEDVYGVGNIPQHIAFLAIDDSENDLPSLLNDGRIVSVRTQNIAKSHLEREGVTWLFAENSLAPLRIASVRAVRTDGRLYVESNLSNIEMALGHCWMQVNNIAFCNGYQEVSVHIITSLAGGFGAGSFINIADLINRKYGERAHIIGYGVLHGVFGAMNLSEWGMPILRLNTYASILDLDYLMQASVVSPIKLEINGAVRELDKPLFDRFYVVDNHVENGGIIANVNELCKVLGSCIFANDEPTPDALRLDWRQGHWNISDKLGWVHTLGGCQVVYKGDLLAHIYGCKAAVELIRKMREARADVCQEAVDWTIDARVREIADPDMLIDSIYPSEAMRRLKDFVATIDDSCADFSAEIEQYTNTFVDFPDAKKLAQLQAEKGWLVERKLNDILMGDGGVSSALSFLDSLSTQLDICRTEMQAEIWSCGNVLEVITPNLEKIYKEYEEYRHRVFKTKSGKQERLDILNKVAKERLRLAIDIKRREAALNIFCYLLGVVKNFKIRINAIDEALDVLSKSYADEYYSVINRWHSQFFEYDLSQAESRSIRINPGDITLPGFIATLDRPLLELDVNNDLKPAIDRFVAELPKAFEYRTKRLIDIINDLDDEAYEVLKAQIVTKSSRLLRLNNRGQYNNFTMFATPTDLMVSQYMISLFGSADEVNACRLAGDAIFNNMSIVAGAIRCKTLANSYEAQRQKMFVLRRDCAVIPYCIGVFNEQVVDEYESHVHKAQGDGVLNPHFDKTIYDEMRRINFTLRPKSVNYDSGCEIDGGHKGIEN